MNSVFITDMAQVSSLGDDLNQFWSSLADGHLGASALTEEFISGKDFPVRTANFLKSDRFELPKLNENLFLSENIPVARHLLSEAGIRMRGRAIDGLIWGHGQTGFKFGNQLDRAAEIFTSARWTREILRILQELDIKIQSDDTVINHANACITGITAISEAFHNISQGHWRRAIVLVQELRCRDWVLWPYYKLNLLSSDGVMRPFSSDRAGFVKGEGGAAFLLESEDAMKESAGLPYARVLSAVHFSDGGKMFEPRQDLQVADACLKKALRDGGLRPSQIDYVNLYGSASRKGDAMEVSLMKKVFGARAYEIPMSTVKPQVGHLNTAAAAIESVATALMIRHQTIAPTCNLHQRDPECDLDFVPNQSRRVPIQYTLKMAYGFGWSNAALLLARP